MRSSLLVCAVVTLAAAPALAGTPKLSRLVPPGGQRGTTVEVIFTGKGLEEPRDVLFYEPGIVAASVEALAGAVEINGRKETVEPGTRVRVRLQLADDCPLGAHGLRLRTNAGLTDYQRFFVGPFPTIDEEELNTKRNDKRENAKEVAVNHTIHGRLNDPADLDCYRLEVKRGQRISAEIEAARLGVERGIPDLHLTITDRDGNKLGTADDSALYLQDPVLSVVAQRDGPHFVEVRHSTFNGAGDTYRLHLGTFARPTAIYPAGGQAGTDLKVRTLGDPLGGWEQLVRLPSAGVTDLPFVGIAPDNGIPAPSPNRLRVSPYPNVLETEPNDTVEAMANASAASLPAAFNGIIGKPGDVDCFRFRAKKGEQIRFLALANALGSPVDPVIWIRAVNGKPNAAAQRVADSRPNQLGLSPAAGLNRDTQDPVLEFTAPADGEYILGVENEREEGGSDFVYRVEAQAQDNAVYTYIVPEPDNRFQPQLRQAVSIPAGNRTTVQVAIFSTFRPFDGDLELVGVNLPKGVTVHAPKLTPGVTRVPVVFEATADAKPQAALVELAVRPVGGQTLNSGYRQVIMMNSYGNNDFYLHTQVDKLALAIGEPAPFRVSVEEPKTSLVQNGEMTLKFKVERTAGFDGPVTVQMEWKPLGISTATPVTVPAGQTEGEYLLGAARNATAGTQLVTLTAMSGAARIGYGDGGNRTYTASPLFKLTVAEPHLEARFTRTSVERGKTATIVCKLNQLQAFEGKAKATLARLPRGVELVEPMREITAADKEVAFTVRATPEALLGNYQGIVLDVIVTEKGLPVRQLSGSGMLRVDAERGAQPKTK